jgi:trehalose 6-phosphate phosphatase
MPTSLKQAAWPLFDHLPDIAAQIQAHSRVLLFLDYDGTLAPIGDDPGKASMPEETRRAIKKLAGSDKFAVVIISGRALPDLRERVRLEELIFAGNHGLEITSPDLHFIEPFAAGLVEPLEELSRHLQVQLRHIPGAEVENKVLTSSVHFRRAAESYEAEIRSVVWRAVETMPDQFQITPGLKVFEIRPRVNWNKGAATRWIRESTKNQAALAIYVGDDATDEDGFAALPDGITVKVGPTTETCARYGIPRQESVGEFLVWLSELH